MNKTRVALFAGQDLGYVMADYFSRREDIDLFVVSFHSQRDILNGYRSALTICSERHIPVIQTDKPGDNVEAALKSWQPDIIVSAYYARLFSPGLLAIPRLGAINAHPGKLPRYQGPMPTPWYILNGEKTFGMAIFKIEPGIDTGPVFVQREYPIADNETGHGLLRKTMHAAADLYKETFDRIVRGEIVAAPQRGEPTFCPRIEAQYRIAWSETRDMILRRIRVHAKPYFPAYTFLYNRMLAINRADVYEPTKRPRASPGEIIEVWDDGRFAVACGDHNAVIAVEYDVCPALEGREWATYFKAGARLA
jgi:methionyl-tRNA formyltransferase